MNSVQEASRPARRGFRIRLNYGPRVRLSLILAAVVGLGFSAWWGYHLPLAPHPEHRPRTWAWLTTPWEINAPARLPVIGGDLIALTRSHDGRYVFVVLHPDRIVRFDRVSQIWLELPAVHEVIQKFPADSEAPSKVDPEQQKQVNATYGVSPATVEVILEDVRQVSAVGFADHAHGFVALDEEMLAITRDGGATWRQILPPTVESGSIRVDDVKDIHLHGGLWVFVGRYEGVGLFAPQVEGEGVSRIETKVTFEEPDGILGAFGGVRHGWFIEFLDQGIRIVDIKAGSVGRSATIAGPDDGFDFFSGSDGIDLDVSPQGSVYFALMHESDEEETEASMLLWRLDSVGNTTHIPTPLKASDGAQFTAASDDDLWFWSREAGLMRSTDAGASWWRAARADLPNQSGMHLRLLPPLFLAIAGLATLVLFVAWHPPIKIVDGNGIADRLTSDRPIEADDPDYFGFGRIAIGLSAYLQNRATTPPLTVAITGPWGAGKSSLMNLVRADLEENGRKTVSFNAWHHETEEHLLAALLEAIRGQAIPGWLEPGGIGFRSRLLWLRGRKRLFLLGVLALTLAAGLGYFTASATRIDAIERDVARMVENIEKSFGGDKTEGTGGDVSASTARTAGSEADAETRLVNGAAGPGDSGAASALTVPPTQKATRGAALATVISLAAIGFTVIRGLRAFGVEPATLLASKSRRASTHDLRAQTSFRYRFRQEFSDVTRALLPRSMTIFIDDLDRCKPEHAYAMLEAVNFLTTSGECVVILGLERARIERAIGIVFKDQAALEPDEHDRRKRERPAARFARRYMEKLINIEVPVPSGTEGQIQDLMGGRDGDQHPEGRKRWHLPKVEPAVVSVLVTVALCVSLYLAVFTWSDVHPPALGPNGVSEPPVGSPEPREDEGPMPPVDPPEEVRVEGSYQAPVAQTKRSHRPLWIVGFIWLGFAGIGLWRVAVRPAANVRDSDAFKAALRNMCPLLLQNPEISPRKVKLFINRVRYYAMVQGDYLRESSAERFLVPLYRWLPRRRTASPSHGAGDAREFSSSPDRNLSVEKLVVLEMLWEVSFESFASGKTTKDLRRALDAFAATEGLTEVQNVTRELTDDDLAIFRQLVAGIRVAGGAKRSPPPRFSEMTSDEVPAPAE